MPKAVQRENRFACVKMRLEKARMRLYEKIRSGGVLDEPSALGLHIPLSQNVGVLKDMDIEPRLDQIADFRESLAVSVAALATAIAADDGSISSELAQVTRALASGIGPCSAGS